MSRRGFQPYLASMPVYNAAAYGQPDSGTGVFLLIVQPSEDLEYPSVVFGVDPYAIVANAKSPPALIACGRHMDPGLCVTAVFYSIVDQVL